MTDRRDFLKATGAAAVGLAIASRPARAHAAPAHEHLDRFRSGASKELLLDAINAAKMAGASYADCRIARFQQNFVVTREQQIINVVDTDTLGAGVRALVDGCWGFAATRTLTREGVTSAAREAVAIAKANPSLPPALRVNVLRGKVDVLLAAGRWQQAQPWLDQAEPIAAALPENELRRLALSGSRARWLLASGDRQAGLPMLDTAIDQLRLQLPDDHPLLAPLLQARGEL